MSNGNNNIRLIELEMCFALKIHQRPLPFFDQWGRGIGRTRGLNINSSGSIEVELATEIDLHVEELLHRQIELIWRK